MPQKLDFRRHPENRNGLVDNSAVKPESTKTSNTNEASKTKPDQKHDEKHDQEQDEGCEVDYRVGPEYQVDNIPKLQTFSEAGCHERECLVNYSSVTLERFQWFQEETAYIFDTEDAHTLLREKDDILSKSDKSSVLKLLEQAVLLPLMDNKFSGSELENFETGMIKNWKDFKIISTDHVKTKSSKQLLQFYYKWKKTNRIWNTKDLKSIQKLNYPTNIQALLSDMSEVNVRAGKLRSVKRLKAIEREKRSMAKKLEKSSEESDRGKRAKARAKKRDNSSTKQTSTSVFQSKKKRKEPNKDINLSQKLTQRKNNEVDVPVKNKKKNEQKIAKKRAGSVQWSGMNREDILGNDIRLRKRKKPNNGATQNQRENNEVDVPVKTKKSKPMAITRGHIKGTQVGQSWKNRELLKNSEVHGHTTCSIHSRGNEGAYSVLVQGKSLDGKDCGDEFTYLGSGKMKFMKLHADQELKGFNKELARCCDAEINEKGAVARDWKNSLQVRVVRGAKDRTSEFAPEDGFRYDGLYKVVKYFKRKEVESGFYQWLFVLRRDDVKLAPWKT